MAMRRNSCIKLELQRVLGFVSVALGTFVHDLDLGYTWLHSFLYVFISFLIQHLCIGLRMAHWDLDMHSKIEFGQCQKKQTNKKNVSVAKQKQDIRQIACIMCHKQFLVAYKGEQGKHSCLGDVLTTKRGHNPDCQCKKVLGT